MNLHEKLAEYCIEQMCEKGEIVYGGRTTYYFLDSKNYPNVHSVDIELYSEKGFLGMEKHKMYISVNIRTSEDQKHSIGWYRGYSHTEKHVSTNSELINQFIKLQKLGKAIEEKREKERQLERLKTFETAIKNTVQGIVK